MIRFVLDFCQKMFMKKQLACASSQLVVNYMELSNKNSVLLISHDASLSGAPVALLRMAEVLREMGYSIYFLSPTDGSIRSELENRGISFDVFPDISSIIAEVASKFSFIVVNTSVNGNVITRLSGLTVPVIWWIHESRAVYSPECVSQLPLSLNSNIHVYAGGSYARRVIKSFRPQYAVQELIYTTEDLLLFSPRNMVTCSPMQHQRRLIFACVGSIEERKGQDILVKAIESLPKSILSSCLFLFVGRVFSEEIYNKIRSLCKRYPEQVKYVSPMDLETLRQFYNSIDVLICSSRDDPMPVVVADVLSLGKIVICSNNTGSAELLRQYSSGFVYETDSDKQLASCICKVVMLSGEQIICEARKGREVFERTFSHEVFSNNLRKLLSKIL